MRKLIQWFAAVPLFFLAGCACAQTADMRHAGSRQEHAYRYDKPNILDAFGKDWFETKEGEASVFKPDGSGKATLVARVQAADWIRAAGGN
jgi:hypothetical protein